MRAPFYKHIFTQSSCYILFSLFQVMVYKFEIEIKTKIKLKTEY